MRLPRGSGVIFRHDSLPLADRRALGRKVAAMARRRGLLLGVAGDASLARTIGAQLVHRPRGPKGSMAFSLPVHDARQAMEARRKGADLVFVSPVHPTRSHPGQTHLSPAHALRLARLSGARAIALGGMDEQRWRALGGAFHGYAGIDCWLEG
jgi:thiamine-phosphate pyrophosphorylase